MLTATVLAEQPVSGRWPELHFAAGEHGHSWMWVLFRDPGGQEWVASFRGGDVPHSNCALLVSDTQDAFVVSRGQGYWLSGQDRSLNFTHDCVVVSAPVPGRELVVVANYTEVAILRAGGVAWRSPRLADDGIELASVDTDSVSGIARGHDGARAFVLHLTSQTVAGGYLESYVP